MPAPKNNQEPVTDVSSTSCRLAYFELIDSDLRQVELRIKDVLAEPDEQISHSLSYLLSSSGKMIRPGLVLLSGACVGSINSEHIDLAAMVELIHMASLLHDDVIDAAVTRRKKQTANARWGNTTAVLLGDYLLSRAFWLGLSVNVDGAADILSSTAREICRGELKQNFRKDQWEIALADYFDIIEAKTAALFESSCRLGAAASKANAEQINALAEFGRHLGIAFQITDDLLDIIGVDERAGKTLGTDLAQGKLTLPVIHWLQHDPQTMSSRINMLQEKGDRQTLIQEMTASGSIEYAFSRIDEAVAGARQVLRNIPGNQALNSLSMLADYVTQRLKR